MATMSGDGGLASPVPPSEESADDFFGQPSRGRRGQANRGDQWNEEEQLIQNVPEIHGATTSARSARAS